MNMVLVTKAVYYYSKILTSCRSGHKNGCVSKCVVLPLGNSRSTDYIMTDASGVQTNLTQVSQVKD